MASDLQSNHSYSVPMANPRGRYQKLRTEGEQKVLESLLDFMGMDEDAILLAQRPDRHAIATQLTGRDKVAVERLAKMCNVRPGGILALAVRSLLRHFEPPKKRARRTAKKRV